MSTTVNDNLIPPPGVFTFRNVKATADGVKSAFASCPTFSVIS